MYLHITVHFGRHVIMHKIVVKSDVKTGCIQVLGKQVLVN